MVWVDFTPTSNAFSNVHTVHWLRIKATYTLEVSLTLRESTVREDSLNISLCVLTNIHLE